MIFKGIDKTLLDLISLLLGAAGVFSVLSKYSVPQLNMTYLGSNPHGVKRDVIDSVTTWVFIILALVGVFVQAIAIIIEDPLSRIYSREYYTYAAALGLILVICLTYILDKFSKVIARLIWKAKLGRLFSEDLDYLHFMVGNENEYAFLYKVRHGLKEASSETSMRIANAEGAQRMIADLENLFEIRVESDDWKLRLSRLSPLIEPYFTKIKDEEY